MCHRSSNTSQPAASPVSYFTSKANDSMDKKAKKRIDLLNKKINDVQQRLAGARKQMDDPSEVAQLEKELAAAKQELEKLKAS